MGSSFGDLFRISTFGESHGGGVGVIVEGCPPRLELDLAEIQRELDRRRPGQSHITTPRKEADQVDVLSGLLDGTTTLAHRSRCWSATRINVPATTRTWPWPSAHPMRTRHIRRNTGFRPEVAVVVPQLGRPLDAWPRGHRQTTAAQGFWHRVLAWVKRIHTIEADAIRPDEVSLEDVEANIVRCLIRQWQPPWWSGLKRSDGRVIPVGV